MGPRAWQPHVLRGPDPPRAAGAVWGPGAPCACARSLPERWWPALEGMQLPLFEPFVFEVAVEAALAQWVWVVLELVGFWLGDKIVRRVDNVFEEMEVRSPACQARIRCLSSWGSERQRLFCCGK